jgi:hypothetical protein
MKRVTAVPYDAHKQYDVMIDQDLLNMKIRIYDENFKQTGTVFYEGSVGKFIKERNPSEFLVNLMTELRHKDKLTYRLNVLESYIERIK